MWSHSVVVVPNVDALARGYRPRVARVGQRGSSVVAALEAAYGSVRESFPELPDAVVITGSGLDGYGLRWGHFAHDRWVDDIAHGRRPELFVGGERLATGAVLTMQTLLHECAHALAVARDVKDTSRGFRYHNKRFVSLANALGLEYPHDAPDSTIGFSAVVLTDTGKARWRDQIDALHLALTLHLDDPSALFGGLLGGGGAGMGGHGAPVRRRRGTGGASYVKATCDCPRVIRVAPSVLAEGEITCDVCKTTFVTDEERNTR
jgi:hypothetical protein